VFSALVKTVDEKNVGKLVPMRSTEPHSPGVATVVEARFDPPAWPTAWYEAVAGVTVVDSVAVAAVVVDRDYLNVVNGAVLS